MAERANDLQQSIEVTRHDIEETRASMTEKLELLEERVRETLEESKSAVEDIVENVKGTVDETVHVVKETVDGAKSTVEDIVENVKGTMDDTVTTVKQAFDLSYQMDRHPWLLFSGSVLLGAYLGSLSQPRLQTNGYEDYEDKEVDEDEAYRVALTGMSSDYAHRNAADSSTSPSQPSRWRSGLGKFQEEIDLVKGAVLGTVMGTLQEMIRQNIPSMAPTLEKVIQSASRKLGAEPIVSSTDQQQSRSGDQGEHPSSSAMGSQYAPSSSRRESSRQPY
jgi:prophage DNA circulation protein